MKKLSFVLLVGLVIVTLFSACTPAPSGPKTVKLNLANNGKSFELNVGDTLELTLTDSPGTGYSWVIVPLKGGVLKQLGDPQPVENEGGETMGGGVNNLWKFEAAAAGEVKLSFGFRRPWEGNLPPDQEFEVTIVVK
jgi:predicted secreted protein